MVLDYYKLREQPFNTSPDSRYLFASESHREALASLLYSIEAGCGFMALIAEPGMGKTTLLFHALNRLKSKTKTAFLFQTITTPEDFLRAVLTDLGIEGIGGGMNELQEGLIGVLLDMSRRGERLVLVVDEAQNLPDSVLEFVRMLSNFETPREKLMHIILSGQQELAHKLMSDNLRQLRQRIAIVAHIRPLTAKETGEYLAHRLHTAGYQSKKPLFTPSALRLIARHGGGIPRKINILCFNALSIGYATHQKEIGLPVLREVVTDLDMSTLLDPSVRQAQETVRRPRLKDWFHRAAALACLLMFLPTTTQESVPQPKSVPAQPASSHFLLPAAVPTPLPGFTESESAPKNAKNGGKPQ